MERSNVIHYEWRNEPQHVWIDGREFRFKSKAEYRWAQYLQLLKDLKAISKWEYEPTTFEGTIRYRKQRIYTPDFMVIDTGEEIYHEVKTALRQKDITRFKYLKADFPDEKIVLVIFGPEHTHNANQNRLRSNARKYVERIVFANPLCKKFGIK